MEDGGPSVTARRVAAHRLGFSRVPAPYGAPAADEALAADVAAGLVAYPDNSRAPRSSTGPSSRMTAGAAGRGRRGRLRRPRFRYAAGPLSWRAAVRRPATLPHYPMVLYRGGYPDGS